MDFLVNDLLRSLRALAERLIASPVHLGRFLRWKRSKLPWAKRSINSLLSSMQRHPPVRNNYTSKRSRMQFTGLARCSYWIPSPRSVVSHSKLTNGTWTWPTQPAKRISARPRAWRPSQLDHAQKRKSKIGKRKLQVFISI